MQVSSAIDLGNQIEKILDLELGSFQTESGVTIPAVWIEPPILPTDYHANGLSCFIQRFPELANNSSPTMGDFRYLERYYTLTLRQYDGSNPASVKLTNAIEKIARIYPLIRPPVYIPPGSNNYEQATLRIVEFDALRTLDFIWLWQ